MLPNIYHYHPDTALLLGQGEADPDPMDQSNWLIPAFATDVEPLAAQEGKTLHFIDGAWVYQDALSAPEPPTLAELQEQAWNAIKSERDRRKGGGAKVTVGDVDYWFHSDDPSRIQQLGLKDQARDILAAGGTSADVLQKLGQDVHWKTMSGAFVPMTVQLAIDVVAAVGDLDAVLFTVAENHRQAMMASVDPTTYDHTVGWPAAYTV